MEDVASLQLKTINSEVLEPLKLALSHNPEIKRVYFKGTNDPSFVTQTISELLSIPRRMIYFFPFKDLSRLSAENLEFIFSKLNLEGVQRDGQPKAVLPLDPYIDSYGPYKGVCEGKYSPLFKSSYVAYVNEREQRELLLKIFSNDLTKQFTDIAEILKKEQSPYKNFSTYLERFSEIQEILQKQCGEVKESDKYKELEEKKKEIVESILNRMWVNKQPGV
jgi:hypothetical protein